MNLCICTCISMKLAGVRRREDVLLYDECSLKNFNKIRKKNVQLLLLYVKINAKKMDK